MWAGQLLYWGSSFKCSPCVWDRRQFEVFHQRCAESTDAAVGHMHWWCCRADQLLHVLLLGSGQPWHLKLLLNIPFFHLLPFVQLKIKRGLVSTAGIFFSRYFSRTESCCVSSSLNEMCCLQMTTVLFRKAVMFHKGNTFQHEKKIMILFPK